MKNWPPRYPRHESAVGCAMALIEKAQTLLEKEPLTPDERKIVDAMRSRNTMLSLSIEEKNKLAILLETFKTIRFRTHKTLISAPVQHFFSLPTRITHAAANALPKRQAVNLSNLLAHDFVVFANEQYDFAKQTGASKRELNTIDPGNYEEQLRAIHHLIRERALPLTPVGK